MKDGLLSPDVSQSTALATITLERPKNRDHGDYATSIALALAKVANKSPRDIAEIIKNGLSGNSAIEKVEIAGPGFINVTLAKSSQGAVVAKILADGEKFGQVSILHGKKSWIEIGRAHV